MINAVVKGQGLKINHPKVVADTIAYLEMSVEFKTTDWDGLVKYVHFTLGDEHYSFELKDDKITQDMHLDLPEGEWEVYIHGSELQDGEVVQRITTEPVTLFVYRTGSLDSEPFPELSGSVGEQVMAKANEAIDVANSVRQDADDGKFKGEQGEKGEKGDTGEKGEPTEVLQTTGDSESAVMSQKAVADALEGKLDKQTTSGGMMAYVVNGEFQRTIRVEQGPVESSIARRTDGGRLKGQPPEENDDLTPKGYVDELVGNIETALDNIIAIQESLIGGGSV